VHLGVRATDLSVEALTEDVAGIVDDDGADERVGTHAATATVRQAQRPAEAGSVIHGLFDFDQHPGDADVVEGVPGLHRDHVLPRRQRAGPEGRRLVAAVEDAVPRAQAKAGVTIVDR
jgi:hypothetical protein